jgi:hypothetical protein
LKTAGNAQSAKGREGPASGWSFRRTAIVTTVALSTVGGLIALLSGSKQPAQSALSEPHVASSPASGAPITEAVEHSDQAGEGQPEEAVRVGREVGMKTTALLNAMANGRNAPHVRQALVKEAAQIPMPFALAVEEVVAKLQPNEQHLHKLFVGLLIDVTAESVGLMSADEQDEFFGIAQRLADHELEIPELIPAPEIADLPKDRFDDLMHHGEVVSNTEGFHLSSLPSKSMAVYLVGMDPDRNRSAEYLSGLSWRSRNTSPRGTAALQAITAQVVKTPESAETVTLP